VSVRLTKDWRKKVEKYEAELRIADEQVYAQYETGFQNIVDQTIFYYRCPTDRFDVRLGVVEGKLEKVFEPLNEVGVPPPSSTLASTTTDL